MDIRKRSLPAGWYPSTEQQIRARIEGYLMLVTERDAGAQAGVVPHAGWDFSGQVAAAVYANLQEEPDTVIVVGGHLAPSGGVLAAYEDGYETPLGVLDADVELLEELRSRRRIREDHDSDNTVEVQLPFVKYFYPSARALALRASPSTDAVELGRVVAEVSERLGRRVTVVGSTDLTHYGSNYGFSPKGTGSSAVKWVKEVNDRRFVESLIAGDSIEAIDRAIREHSACSAGGAVVAARFAAARGATRGRLLAYMTSYDVHPSASFVGYAGIVWLPES